MNQMFDFEELDVWSETIACADLSRLQIPFALHRLFFLLSHRAQRPCRSHESTDGRQSACLPCGSCMKEGACRTDLPCQRCILNAEFRLLELDLPPQIRLGIRR